MKKKNTKTGKAAVKSTKKTRLGKRVAAKKKTSKAIGKVAPTLSGTKTASLKRSIRKIKTSLKQLEKAVGK